MMIFKTEPLALGFGAVIWERVPDTVEAVAAIAAATGLIGVRTSEATAAIFANLARTLVITIPFKCGPLASPAALVCSAPRPRTFKGPYRDGVCALTV